MTHLRSVPFLQTEVTLRLITATLAESSAVAARQVGSARIRRSELLGPVAQSDVQAQAGYFRMLSLAESYTDSIHELLLQRQTGTATTQTLLRAVDEHLLSASTSWPRRQEAFRRVHSIRLSDCPAWTELAAAREARNAIAHAQGRLTRRQRRNPTIVAKLGSINVAVAGARLRFTYDSLVECARVSQAYVRWLDGEAQTRIP